MQIQILEPIYLLLLLLLPLLWFFPKKVTKGQYGVAVFRSMVMIAIVLGLSKPVWLLSDTKEYNVFILDQSESLTEEQKQKSKQILSDLLKEKSDVKEELTLISIGASPTESIDNIEDKKSWISIEPENSRSSMSQALEVAIQQIPYNANGNITLITDGLTTDRDWGNVMQQIVEKDIPVNTYFIESDYSDIYPASMEATETVHTGQTMKLKVALVGLGEVTVNLIDELNQEILASQRVQVNKRTEVEFEYEPKQEGFLQLTTKIEVASGNDTNKDNNQLSKTFAVQRPIKTLYVGTRSNDAIKKLTSLLGEGHTVSTPSSFGDLTGSMDLEQYDLLMIDDVPEQQLPKSFQKHVSNEIQQKGLGLIYSGGKNAFGSGGYLNSEIAEVLPVSFQQTQEKPQASIALALVIDTSGSMHGKYMSLAKQVAHLALDRLRPTDLVGIVEFYGNRSWKLPLQSVRKGNSARRAISMLQASGGTTLLPAIEEAVNGLMNVQARYKHLLIISDAGVERAEYSNLIREANINGIVLSTVLTYDRNDNYIMSHMAQVGGGNFYSVPDKFSLIDIDLKKVTKKLLPSYKEGSYQPDMQNKSLWWGDLDDIKLPQVNAYVETQNRPGAQIFANIKGKRHPLLSTWQYGLGQVTAVMTEPLGWGTKSWQQWKDYGRLLSRAFIKTAKSNQFFDYDFIRTKGQLHIIATRLIKNANKPLLKLNHTSSQEIPFSELAPGWFSAQLSIPDHESIQLTDSTMNDQRHFVIDPIQMMETQVDPVLGINLPQLSQLTGGSYLNANTKAVESNTSNESTFLRLYHLMPWLLAIALLLYLAEILYRRLPNR